MLVVLVLVLVVLLVLVLIVWLLLVFGAIYNVDVAEIVRKMKF